MPKNAFGDEIAAPSSGGTNSFGDPIQDAAPANPATSLPTVVPKALGSIQNSMAREPEYAASHQANPDVRQALGLGPVQTGLMQKIPGYTNPDIAGYFGNAMSGVERMASGKGSDIAGGGSQLFRSASALAAPSLLGPALVAAPAATLGGVAGGTLGSAGTKMALSGANIPQGYKDALEDVGGVAGGVLGGVAGKGLQTGTQALTKVNPTRAAVRALQPGSNNLNFSEKVPAGLSDIKAASPNVNSIESMISAAKESKKTLQGGLGTYLDAHREMGTVRPGTPIIQATEAALPSSIAPSEKAAVMNEANRIYGGNMTTDQMRTLLSEKNAELNSFYNKSQQGQNATTVAGKYEGVLKAQRDALAEHLYNTLDSENQGAGPREIQQRTGNVTELENAAQNRRNAAIAEKPVTPLGGIGKIVQHGARAIISPLHAGIEGGMEMQGVRHPFIGPIDATLRQAFGATGEAPPIPNYQAPSIKGLLGPGPLITPPPADTSGPIGSQINPTLPKWMTQKPLIDKKK